MGIMDWGKMADKNKIGKPTPSKSQKSSVASSNTSKTPDARPWYQMKRVAFPAIGLVALSMFALAFGLIQSQPGSSSAVNKNSGASASPSASPSSSKVTDGGATASQAPVQAPAPAQPAPAPPAPKPAPPQPSSKEASAQAAEETETDNQYYAREDAYYFWSNAWYSRSGLINELVNTMGHSYADAEYGVDFQGIDWSTEAFGMAATFIGDYYYSRESLIVTLIGEGFSASEAEYGADSLDWDWYREAYLYAVDLFNQGYLEEEIYNELIGVYFTEDEAFYGSYFAANPQ